MTFRVLIPQDISSGGKDYLIERGYEVTVDPDGVINPAAVGKYDAILLRTAVVDRKILDAAKKLRVIGRYGVGVGNIDLAACKEKGVQVTFAPWQTSFPSPNTPFS